MDDNKTGFPNTTAEREYVDAAKQFKSELNEIFGSIQDYKPGTSSDKLSELSALMGKRKKESNEAFDKIAEEVLSNIDEQGLIQQEKLLGGEGGETDQ